MSHPAYFISDSVVIGLTTAVAALATPLLADTAAAQSNSEMLLFILPLIGAMIMSGGAILLNPQMETRKIVIGRSIIALLCGATMPTVLGMFYPVLDPARIKPAALALMGAVIAAVAYVMSRPFFGKMYERAEGLAKKAVDELEKRAGGGGV